MGTFDLHQKHKNSGAHFRQWETIEVPGHYGDPKEEHLCIRKHSGLIDQSSRGRLAVKGNDRVEFLNGMLTNDISILTEEQGCYAVITDSKAKMLSDCRIYALPDQFLLDLEPGMIKKVHDHLDRYIIAADVTLENLTESWAMLSLYGPESSHVLTKALKLDQIPEEEYSSRAAMMGEFDLLCVRNDITGEIGYDLYLPVGGVEKLFNILMDAGTRLVGWTALETLRIEAGIPRYGLDMDQSYFPMEAQLTQRAISETKGCYIGQETIARALAQGKMNRLLVGLEVKGEVIPQKNQAIMKENRAIGKITSAVQSPTLGKTIALGYVHRDFSKPGSTVSIIIDDQPIDATVVDLPFYKRAR